MFESIFIVSTLLLFFVANKIIGTFIIIGALIFLFYYTNKSKVKKYGTSLNERGERLKITRESIVLGI